MLTTNILYVKITGLIWHKWEYHLSITTPETPSYTPKRKKVPRLLARNPQISSIKIDDIQSFQPGFSAGVESSSFWLAIIIGDDAACMG